MREIRERAYDILHQIDSYVKTYEDVLDKPRRKYMRDMTLGTIRSKSLILSQIAQKIRGITDRCKNSHQTEKRLSYNLNSPEWTIQEMRDIHYQDMLSYVTDDTLIILDTSDIQKPYGRKLPDLKSVRDGSTGDIGLGYQMISAILKINRRMIFPLWLDSFSSDEVGFKSQNVEIFDVIKPIFAATDGRGVLVYDIELDARHNFDDLLDMHIRFVVRLKGDRYLNFQDGKAIVNEKIDRNQLRYSSSVPVKRRKRGGRTHWKLRYDYFPVTLPRRDGDQLYLIVGYREGKAKPIYLLVSVPISSPRDALKWLKGYFKRWGIEDILRFWKQKFGLEDIRTTDIDNFKKLLWIAVVAFAFMTVYLLTDLKLRRLLIALTHRPRLAKQVAFLYYRIQKAVDKLFEVFSPILMKDIMST